MPLIRQTDHHGHTHVYRYQPRHADAVLVILNFRHKAGVYDRQLCSKLMEQVCKHWDQEKAAKRRGAWVAKLCVVMVACGVLAA